MIRTVVLVMMLAGSGWLLADDDKKDPPTRTDGMLPAGFNKLGLSEAQRQKVYDRMEKRQLPLSQSTRQSPPGGQSLPRKRPAVLQTAREWLQIVRDRIENLLGYESRPGRQNRPAL